MEGEAAQMEIRYLKGVGEKRAALLEKLGIHSVEDLLEFYPRDYVDYSKPYPAPHLIQNAWCARRCTRSTHRCA